MDRVLFRISMGDEPVGVGKYIKRRIYIKHKRKYIDKLIFVPVGKFKEFINSKEEKISPNTVSQFDEFLNQEDKEEDQL